MAEPTEETGKKLTLERELENIMRHVLRKWPSDVEPDGTTALVALSMAQAKRIREMIQDADARRREQAWQRQAGKEFLDRLEGKDNPNG